MVEAVGAVVVRDRSGHDPRRSSPSVLLDPDLADPLGRSCVEAEPGQRQAVEGHGVRRHGSPRLDHHRVLAACAIEKVAVGEAPFRQVSPRASHEEVRFADGRGHDPFARLGALGPRRDPLDDVRVRDRVGDVHERLLDEREVQQVRMRVDQPGKDRRGVELDRLDARAHRLAYLLACTHGLDAAAGDPDGLDAAKLRIHGADRSALQDQLWGYPLTHSTRRLTGQLL